MATTYAGELGWVYFFSLLLGLGYVVLCLMSIIWFVSACCQKKSIKKQYTLQTRIFFFIFMNCLLRTIQHLILYPLCPYSSLIQWKFCNDPEYFLNLEKVNMFVDLLAEWMVFATFFTIAGLWASRYYTSVSFEGKSMMKKCSDIMYYVCCFSFLIVIIAECIFFLFYRNVHFDHIEFRVAQFITRASCMVVVSVSLFYFGVKVQRSYRHSKSRIKVCIQLYLIMIVCGGIYLCIVIFNFSKFVVFLVYPDELYNRSIWYNILSFVMALMDQASNLLLLIFLIPENVNNLCCNCMTRVKTLMCVRLLRGDTKGLFQNLKEGKLDGGDESDDSLLFDEDDDLPPNFYETFAMQGSGKDDAI